MIWDVHTHLSGVDGRTPEERMANLIRFADRMGIERVCVFMGYPFLTDPTPPTTPRAERPGLAGARATTTTGRSGSSTPAASTRRRASARSTAA